MENNKLYNNSMSESMQGLEQVTARNLFYRTAYFRMLCLVLLQLLVITVLVIFLNQQKANFPMPKYFPTTADGKLIEMPPLNQPYVSDAVVKNWVSKTVAKIYNIDFANYRQALQEMRPLFTAKGHQKYLNAWHESNNLESIKNNKQILYATIDGEAKIIGRKIRFQQYTWDVTLPITLTYTNVAQDTVKQKVQVLAKISRVNTLQNKYGLAVYQIILETV